MIGDQQKHVSSIKLHRGVDTEYNKLWISLKLPDISVLHKSYKYFTLCLYLWWKPSKIQSMISPKDHNDCSYIIITALKVPAGSLMNCVGWRYCKYLGWTFVYVKTQTQTPASQRWCTRSRCEWQSRPVGCKPGGCSPDNYKLIWQQLQTQRKYIEIATQAKYKYKYRK